MSTIDTSLHTSTQYQSTLNKAGEKQAANGKTFTATDTAEISEQAKLFSEGVSPASTRSAGMAGIAKYMKSTAGGEGGLGARNATRKSIGARIDSVLKTAGIKLGKNEKISISVNGKNEISVKGVKDKQKREAIEKALNDDPKLGRELRQYSAEGKISEYARRQEEYEKAMAEIGMIGAAGSEASESYNNPGMNALIMDEFLQEKAGLSLADLSLEKGADGATGIAGLNDDLRALMESDSELAGTITSLLESGATVSDAGASFEFANGVISGGGNVAEAKDKTESIKNLLFGTEEAPGPLTAFRKKLENEGIEIDPVFYKALSQGFQVEVSSSGQFKVVGLEGLTDMQKDTLENLLQEAIDMWAETDEKNAGNPELAEAAKQNGRDATLRDVLEAYVMEHQFEHGDTEEFEHKITINFGGNATAIDVISPVADKARDEDNQKLADELGVQMKGMLEKSGIKTEGLELEIDEKGKITVVGDPANVEVRKAQDVLDQWVKDTKDQGALENKGAVDRKEEAASHEGRKADAWIPDGWGEQSVVASSGDETYKQMQYTAWRNDQYAAVKQYLPDGEEAGLKTERNQVAFAKYIGWQRDMIEAGDILKMSGSDLSTSKIKPAKYGNSYDDEATNESAQSLYLRMLDSMGQFHDGRKQSSYTFKVA